MNVPKIDFNVVLQDDTQAAQQNQHDLLPGSNELSPSGIESFKEKIKTDGEILRKFLDTEK